MSTTKKKEMTTVKVPKDLHEEIRKIAERDGKYLERVVQDLLKKGIEATEK